MRNPYVQVGPHNVHVRTSNVKVGPILSDINIWGPNMDIWGPDSDIWGPYSKIWGHDLDI